MTKSMIVGEKIDILFEVVVKANGKPYKGKEVSKYTGVPETTISNLRHNPTLNPTIASLQELCKFFGVSLAYFDCNTPEECRVFIAKSRNRNGFDGVADNPVLSEITLRAMRMSHEGQREALRMLEWLAVADRAMRERREQELASV